MTPDLDKKIAYYQSAAFANELVALMIPDVNQYINNIVSNFFDASQSKRIYCDITNQLLELRKKNKTFYSTFSYNVGSLSVDGKAFANKILRDWCSYMHKIAGSLLQIINIVYDLKNESNDVKFGTTIKKLNNNQLLSLWNKLNSLLEVEFDLDNKTKHRLNVGVSERFSPRAFEHIEYFITDANNEPIFVRDLMDEGKGILIAQAVFELLDFLIIEARTRSYPNRAYVELSIDPDKLLVGSIELVNEIDEDTVNILSLITETEKQMDGTHICKKTTLYIDSDPLQTLFLTKINKIWLKNGTLTTQIANFRIKRIEVIKSNSLIGYYHLESPPSIGLQFSRYSFVPNS